jgi:hypothetical protein
LKWGNLLNPGWLRAFSLISGSVSKKRSATRNKSTRRRSEDMKKKCTGKNEKSMRENKSVHIGDVRSSDTAEMKV